MSDRRAHLDWARGLAVLLMIEAHTSDAWTRPADRATTAFGVLRLLGGFAAPFFLWLAGAGVAMSAARTLRRTGRRADVAASLTRRGLEIFLLAFLFRLQAFVVSPGSDPVMIFRVDILNVMGPAIVAAGLLWAVCTRTGPRLFAAASAATAVAMTTPIVRTWPGVNGLPIWLQWYVRPAGEHTTFTLLPWAGFVLAGTAAGVVLMAERADVRWGPRAIGVGGAALVFGGLFAATLPSIYADSSFWTSSPAWFAIRTGIVMLCVWLLAELEWSVARRWQPPLSPLARLGQASLFVYWIHVELVYGYASWLWHGRLPVWLTVCAFVLFSALMYQAVLARDRYRARKSAAFARRMALPQA